ncbi:MAG: hypothetical protein KDA88_19080 [Planctomycetaceae bacterium]|nr:hypothetical protein [Planctomycetaceae bacterium]MCB9952837.1 hypothetical protein [Planctomycetaceae bacterium]
MRWLKLCLLDLWATLWSKFPEPENYPPEILELNEWSRSLRPSDKVDYDVLLAEVKDQFSIARESLDRMNTNIEWAFGVAMTLFGGLMYVASQGSLWATMPALLCVVISLGILLKAKWRSAVALPKRGRILHEIYEGAGEITPHVFAATCVSVEAARHVNRWKSSHLGWASALIVLSGLLAVVPVSVGVTPEPPEPLVASEPQSGQQQQALGRQEHRLSISADE